GFDYLGMSFQEQVASQGVPATAVFGFSVLVVFLLMAALYESWTLPFAVLLATPIAMFGALGALWLRRFELDVFSQIGLLMVIGRMLAGTLLASLCISVSFYVSGRFLPKRKTAAVPAPVPAPIHGGSGDGPSEEGQRP